jgi:hypothetical protein
MGERKEYRIELGYVYRFGRLRKTMLPSPAVGTGTVVQALVGNPQPFDGFAAHQMLADNRFGIGRGDVTIPNRLGIDDHNRPVLALIQTTGFVDADAVGKTGFVNKFLQLDMQLAGAVSGTGAARRASRTMVHANENVMFESWHRKRPSGSKKIARTLLEYGIGTGSAKMDFLRDRGNLRE